jgi:hypothetical protein
MFSTIALEVILEGPVPFDSSLKNVILEILLAATALMCK